MASAGDAAQVFGREAKGTASRAAQHPSVQSAAWNVARERASQGAQHAKAGFVEVRQHIQESHCSLQILCFISAVALLVSSILGVINIFNAVFKPLQYVFAFWNIVFAAVIIVIDGRSEWFSSLQAKVFSGVAVLASYRGRALFYLYVGSINLLMLPHSWFWKLVYVVIGSTLICISAIMLLNSFNLCGSSFSRQESDAEIGTGSA